MPEDDIGAKFFKTKVIEILNDVPVFSAVFWWETGVVHKFISFSIVTIAISPWPFTPFYSFNPKRLKNLVVPARLDAKIKMRQGRLAWHPSLINYPRSLFSSRMPVFIPLTYGSNTCSIRVILEG